MTTAHVETSSEGCIDIEFSDTDPGFAPPVPRPHTPRSLLNWMQQRVIYYGAPLPDGYVAPPGIDLDALLKQVPWPPKDEH